MPPKGSNQTTGRAVFIRPKARNNANIAQESEQKDKSESMLDLDSTSVSEECAMVCTELQYEDASKNEAVYSD